MIIVFVYVQSNAVDSWSDRPFCCHSIAPCDNAGSVHRGVVNAIVLSAGHLVFRRHRSHVDSAAFEAVDHSAPLSIKRQYYFCHILSRVEDNLAPSRAAARTQLVIDGVLGQLYDL